MIGAILAVIGLPLPPERKFAKEPYYLDWYDTGESESLLHFQSHSFTDYLDDFTEQLSRRYGRLFLPVMRHFIGPVFGQVITGLL